MPNFKLQTALAIALAALCLHGADASAQSSRGRPGARPSVEALQVDSAISALQVFANPLSRWEDITSAIAVDGPVYRDFVLSADSALRNSGFATYENPRWIEEQGRVYLESPDTIMNASVPEIRALLGGISRSEKFVSGRMGKAIIDGVYQRALQRLVQLKGI